MADIRLTPEDIEIRIKQQIKQIAKAPPHVKTEWLQARKYEQAGKISSKEQEIAMIKNVRLRDLNVELEMLKMDLEILEEVERRIQTIGIEYLESNKPLEIENKK